MQGNNANTQMHLRENSISVRRITCIGISNNNGRTHVSLLYYIDYIHNTVFT